MNDVFQRRVRGAAIAGWWTVLIAAGYLTLVWIVFLVIGARRLWSSPIVPSYGVHRNMRRVTGTRWG